MRFSGRIAARPFSMSRSDSAYGRFSLAVRTALIG
jgi:hypothetical protein